MNNIFTIFAAPFVNLFEKSKSELISLKNKMLWLILGLLLGLNFPK